MLFLINQIFVKTKEELVTRRHDSVTRASLKYRRCVFFGQNEYNESFAIFSWPDRLGERFLKDLKTARTRRVIQKVPEPLSRIGLKRRKFSDHKNLNLRKSFFEVFESYMSSLAIFGEN